MTRLLHRLPLDPAVLLAPGLRLLGVLSVRWKLALVAACLLLPMASLSLWVARLGVQALQELQLQHQGLARHAVLQALRTELHKHRVLTERTQAGDATAAAPRAEVAAALAQAGTAAERALQADAALAEAWQAVSAAVRALPTGPAAAHADVAERLAQLTRLNAERSGLQLARDAADPARMQLLVDVLPALADVVARAAAQGSATLVGAGRETVAAEARTPLVALALRTDLALQAAAASQAALQRAAAPAAQAWPAARQAVDGFATLLHEAFARERPELPAAALHAAGLEALALTDRLATELLAGQAQALDARLARQRLQLAAAAAAVLGALALTLYALACLHRSFTDSLAALQLSTQAVSSGDLSTHVELPGHDELAAIGRSVNGMSDRLSSLVSEIRSSAARVNMAGTQVAEGSQRLSQRTEEQASRLRESVQAISRLSEAVSDNARGARELDSLTEQLARQATEGHKAMGETISSVAQLQDASRRVFEVVAVIDDVAFQTGMLSLNAAVEAARAGEAGRGFALVASEVRSLAQRVGESADEIRALITHASDQLEFSSTKLGSANGALDGVVRGVHDVSSRLCRIAQASTEQSEQLVSVAQGVGDLDQITRDNARLVDESTFASQALLERARVLREAVAPMKLRQGSADEAHELLDRAWSHVMQLGNEQGLKDLHDPALGFIDRDLYVFALDRAGVYVACGAKPEMVGSSVNELPGIRGTPFVQQAWAAAEAGGGWVEYEIANPLTGEVTPKESYVRQLDDALLLGCGVYRRAAAAPAAAKPRAAAWSRSQQAQAGVAA